MANDRCTQRCCVRIFPLSNIFVGSLTFLGSAAASLQYHPKLAALVHFQYARMHWSIDAVDQHKNGSRSGTIQCLRASDEKSRCRDQYRSSQADCPSSVTIRALIT